MSSVRVHEITIFAFLNVILKNRIPAFKSMTDNVVISFYHCRMPGLYSLFLWHISSSNQFLNTKKPPVPLHFKFGHLEN